MFVKDDELDHSNRLHEVYFQCRNIILVTTNLLFVTSRLA